VCYGEEPAWALDLREGSARLRLVGEEDADFTGRATAIEALKVRVWRGRGPAGGSGDLVAFLTETACSEGMSDLKRPFTARVSLPDGRVLAGCCRPATGLAPSGSGGAASPTSSAKPSVPPPPAAAARVVPDWADSLVDYHGALRSCTSEVLRTEAVVFAEKRPNNKVHLVLRIPGPRYVDCEAAPEGAVRVRPREKNAALSPVEQAVLLTLLPGEPPRGACDRSEPAFDEKGHPFGWITRKGC
jgi:hypothetical protein